jgi:hypothetical protein
LWTTKGWRLVSVFQQDSGEWRPADFQAWLCPACYDARREALATAESEWQAQQRRAFDEERRQAVERVAEIVAQVRQIRIQARRFSDRTDDVFQTLETLTPIRRYGLLGEAGVLPAVCEVYAGALSMHVGREWPWVVQVARWIEALFEDALHRDASDVVRRAVEDEVRLRDGSDRPFTDEPWEENVAVNADRSAQRAALYYLRELLDGKSSNPPTKRFDELAKHFR